MSTQTDTKRILVLHENGGHHIDFTRRAQPWLDQLAIDENLTLDYRQDTAGMDDDFFGRYALVLQLDFPPYAWADVAATSFERYIDTGRGGWVGLHHASLLGEFDGYPMWQSFSTMLGGIRYKNYIPGFAEGEVDVEDGSHPVMRGVPPRFAVDTEEWYTYDRSPRPNVRVLATVDESTYTPETEVKMGDHPVVWTNPSVAARNVYIFMGHSPRLFENDAYVTLLRNAILWGAGC